MKIGIADPQGRVRFSLRVLLEQQDWAVSVEAADCDELFDMLGMQSPDVLLVDMDLPGLLPEDLLRLLQKQYPLVRIVVMSGRQDFDQAAMAAGADAFACKAEPPDKLLNLIRKLDDSTGTTLAGGGSK